MGQCTVLLNMELDSVFLFLFGFNAGNLNVR